MLPHSNDPTRKIMLLNFYSDRNLQAGKEILNSLLAGDSTRYVNGFIQVAFTEPDPTDHSALTRYRRRVMAYRALLAKSGYALPQGMRPQLHNLFGRPLLEAMLKSQGRDAGAHVLAANILGRSSSSSGSSPSSPLSLSPSSPAPSWDEVVIALEALYDYITDRESGYAVFEAAYMLRSSRSSTGERWADDDLLKILAMLHYPNGSRLVGQARSQHTPTTHNDYAEEIYRSLLQGKLVLIDQSSGDPQVNASSAERIMWHLFRSQQRVFASGRLPSDILVYIEEAHNLLPAGGAGAEADLQNVWSRTAKEGAKYRIGMVYATQEVSSIQRNILKNTANWLIAHLNNTDETKELRKYYDFADWEEAILRCAEPGFIRLKTLSNPFTVPVQANRFVI